MKFHPENLRNTAKITCGNPGIADTEYVLVTNIVNDEWFEYLKEVADEIVENRFQCSALFVSVHQAPIDRKSVTLST